MGNFIEMQRSNMEKDYRYIRSSFAEVLSQYPEGITLIENEVKKKMPNWVPSVPPAVNVRNFAQTETRRLQSARPTAYRPNSQTNRVKKEPVDQKPRIMIGRSKSAKPILQCCKSEEAKISKNNHSSSPAILLPSKAQNKDPSDSLFVQFSTIRKVHPIPKRTKSNKRPKQDIQEIHVQLQRIRKDIDELSSKLTAEIPEGITCHGLSYFDDDSKRWFARELYSLRHECAKVYEIENKKAQLLTIVKIYRTSCRVLQVAASRPVLRIIHPYIYSELGHQIHEISRLADHFKMPFWDTDRILTALETALENVPIEYRKKNWMRQCHLPFQKPNLLPAHRLNYKQTNKHQTQSKPASLQASSPQHNRKAKKKKQKQYILPIETDTIVSNLEDSSSLRQSFKLNEDCDAPDDQPSPSFLRVIISKTN